MDIGRLEKQDIHKLWPTEAGSFTPWLAEPENLALLADTLGLGDLTQIETEQSVGAFRADILCRDMLERVVVIENQFGTSDHGHLGQTLTYLVGRKAHTLVWICERLRDEHRAVIDWLNDTTPLDYVFFGVQVEVWRIGDSAFAPKFEIVSQPNNWERQQQARTRSQTASYDPHRRVDYWNALLEKLPSLEVVTAPDTAPGQGWLLLPFNGRWRIPSGGGIYAYRLVNEGRVGVYLSIGKQSIDTFEVWREAQTETFGSLKNGVWEQNKRGILSCFITLDANALDESDWPNQHSWMVDRIREFADDWRAGLHKEVLSLLSRDVDCSDP